ncbi:MAG: toprim domain-containing protein [Kiritimatiellae bacterium]|nr:toprim domain-containing protein [Kiritimatiellia bacterium]
MPANSYDEAQIQTLSAIEHIRTRTGMYIGRTSDGSQYEDGIYILLKEVLDNAVDEFIMGYGKRVEISLNYDSGEVAVRDYGRGIPLGKVVDCVSQINTGGKFNDDAFQFSVGMNGVGTKAVNALSTVFEVRSFRDGHYSEAFFKKGQIESRKTGKCAKPERNGTFVRFTPDPDIFKKYRFKEEHVLRRMRMYAYLNAGLVMEINGNKIVSENGLLDLIHDEAQFEKLYQPFHYRSKQLELVFTHTNRFSEDYYSFVNGQFTNDGGVHLSAFKEGILKAVNGFSKKKFDGDDVREGIIGAIAIRLKDPVFESQTKNRLGNQDIRSDLVAEIKRVVEEMFHRAPAEAGKLISKIEDTSKLRAELNSVKKLARERSRAVSVRVPQLKDCKHHLHKQRGTGLDTMIFITEGQSAAGSIVSCRDVNTQAIFTLKGKPLNVCDCKRDALYKNVEIYNLMQSLDIEETVDHLRYQKVILATDADVDGLHIRNLMITLFLRFFDRVIKEGHLYILETPLFRVRNKKESHYCYNEEERLRAMQKCGTNPEITRFKGLGEISPNEFKAFIGKSMRLTPVDSSLDHAVTDTIEFYMGRNTPERRQYIMSNLVITEDSLS